MDYVDTILTSSDANNFFGSSQCLCGSETLEATLRYIAIRSNGGDIESTKLIRTTVEQAGYGFSNGNPYTEEAYDGFELVIVTPANRGDALLAITKNDDGWTSLDSPPYPVAPLLSARASETRIYINSHKKRSIVFVRTTTQNWCDLFASCLFRVLPWRFDDDQQVAALAKAIAQNRPSEFKDIINSCCEGFDLAGSVARRTLLGWGNEQRTAQMQQLKNTMENCMNFIRLEEQRIAEYLERYNIASENYKTWEKSIVENDSTFYDFFSSHKQLSIFRVYNSSGGNGKSLEYCVLETIEYYDEDNFINNYNTPSSNVGRCGDDMRRILYGIFKEHKGVIRTEAIFKLTNLAALTVVGNAVTIKHSDTHLPHPHLVNYGCLGGNGSQITRYMQNGDWDLAIEQSIAAVKNINMGDAVVFSSLIRDLRNAMDNCSCIVTEDGRAMTPREFLNYLREGDNKENTNG